MARFLVIPQWQGSPSARAMLLTEGAAAIAGDLPRSATTLLDVPLEAGDALDTGVRRFTALQHTRDLVIEHLQPGDIVIGGDGSVTAAALAALRSPTEGPAQEDLALLWCAAQPALHTPENAPSGSFAEMTLSAILGQAVPVLDVTPPLPAESLVLAGVRDITPAEAAPLGALRQLSTEDLARSTVLTEAFAEQPDIPVWVHIDVSVLDPADFSGSTVAAPFGLRAAELIAALRDLRAHHPLAGATIAGFMPRTPEAAADDLSTILRLLGALT